MTIKSTSTEMLLALGLGDRIVGLGFQDGPVPDIWENGPGRARCSSDKVPSEEVVLEQEPDLVYAGWESNFSPEGAGTRDDLERARRRQLRLAVRVPERGPAGKLPPGDDIFSDIREVGAIFGVEDRARGARRTRRSACWMRCSPNNGLGRTALWYSSGSDTPYVGGGIGAPQLLMETVGLENIAADIDATWAPFNWEAVVDADPDFIILIDAAWNTADHKIDVLESNPATAQLTAVRFGNYLILPFAASEAGVRSVESAAVAGAPARRATGTVAVRRRAPRLRCLGRAARDRGRGLGHRRGDDRAGRHPLRRGVGVGRSPTSASARAR